MSSSSSSATSTASSALKPPPTPVFFLLRLPRQMGFVLFYSSSCLSTSRNDFSVIFFFGRKRSRLSAHLSNSPDSLPNLSLSLSIFTLFVLKQKKINAAFFFLCPGLPHPPTHSPTPNLVCDTSVPQISATARLWISIALIVLVP